MSHDNGVNFNKIVFDENIEYDKTTDLYTILKDGVYSYCSKEFNFKRGDQVGKKGELHPLFVKDLPRPTRPLPYDKYYQLPADKRDDYHEYKTKRLMKIIEMQREALEFYGRCKKIEIPVSQPNANGSDKIVSHVFIDENGVTALAALAETTRLLEGLDK